MANSLCWKYLDAPHIRTLGDETSVEKTKALICKFLQCDDGRTESQTAVEVDYYFYNLAFARDNSFSPEKTSTFLSIAVEVLEADRADGLRTMDDSFDNFKKMIHDHSVDRPPHSVEIFSTEDVELIVDYFVNGYFRHFRLYKYTMAAKPQLVLRQTTSCKVEQPALRPPLSEALVETLTIAEATGVDEAPPEEES